MPQRIEPPATTTVIGSLGMLNYAQADESRRATACGLASICAATLVLAVPGLLMLYNLSMKSFLFSRTCWTSSLEVTTLLTIIPAIASIAPPVLGITLSATGLALGCNAKAMVVGGMAVDIAGILAAIGLFLV